MVQVWDVYWAKLFDSYLTWSITCCMPCFLIMGQVLEQELTMFWNFHSDNIYILLMKRQSNVVIWHSGPARTQISSTIYCNISYEVYKVGTQRVGMHDITIVRLWYNSIMSITISCYEFARHICQLICNRCRPTNDLFLRIRVDDIASFSCGSYCVKQSLHFLL